MRVGRSTRPRCCCAEWGAMLAGAGRAAMLGRWTRAAPACLHAADISHVRRLPPTLPHLRSTRPLIHRTHPPVLRPLAPVARQASAAPHPAQCAPAHPAAHATMKDLVCVPRRAHCTVQRRIADRLAPLQRAGCAEAHQAHPVRRALVAGDCQHERDGVHDARHVHHQPGRRRVGRAGARAAGGRRAGPAHGEWARAGEARQTMDWTRS